MPTRTRTDHLPVARRTWYQPAPSVFTDTERPGRAKVTDACFAGTLHGASATHTGVIGPIVTEPQSTPATSTASGMPGA